METVEIIIPKVANEAELLDFCLVNLTRAIDQIDGERVAHGVLGGEHGYGAEFENEVFEMHPQYWGDCTCGYAEKERAWCDSHKHTELCYQAEYRAIPYNWLKQQKQHNRAAKELCKKHGIPWNNGNGSAVHCTCEYENEWKKWNVANDHAERCPVMLPNFRHKASGLTVTWYKWIGRDMSMENPSGVSVAAVFRECMDSLRQP